MAPSLRGKAEARTCTRWDCCLCDVIGVESALVDMVLVLHSVLTRLSCCLLAGDTVLIKGRRGRETVCVVVPEEKMEEDHIALPKNALDWLRVLLCV